MAFMPDFANTRVLVIGDVMLDKYWHGDTSRISPEAPVPVVNIGDIQVRAGGAANVALNLSALGVTTTLIGAAGKDEAGNVLANQLKENGVRCDFFYTEGLPTITKLRVLGRHQQLIRLDFEQKMPSLAPYIDGFIQAHLQEADVVILSDYAKGVLAEPQKFIQAAKALGKKVLVDPKHTDFSVYAGADLITPNWQEFQAAAGNCDTETQLSEKGSKILKSCNLGALLVTRGAKGMSLLSQDEKIVHIPVHEREVFDVTGAGDTVIALMGACIAAKASLAEGAKIANFAASIVVGKLGTATISREEIEREYQQSATYDSTHCLVDVEKLLQYVKADKKNGQKIVMTNGCFDLLHAGHITYLEQAKALGDKLIVAVNDDGSVSRLKGQSRPINTLADRMRILGALKCVDWVVPFSEDTPRDLIAKVLPDILVKGGDYRPEAIAGGKEVVQNGGDIKILPFLDGRSTTSMLDKIEKGKMRTGLEEKEKNIVTEKLNERLNEKSVEVVE